MTRSALDASTWPFDRLGDAMAMLAASSGHRIRHGAGSHASPSPGSADPEDLSLWVDAYAKSLRIQATPVRIPFRTVGASLAESGPALVVVGEDEPRVVALRGVRGGRARLLGPDGRYRTVEAATIAATIGGRADPSVSTRVDSILHRAQVASSRRTRARAGMLREILADRLVDVGWTLGLPPNAPFGAQLRAAGIWTSAATILVMQLVKQTLGLLGWWLIGRGALQGQLETGWLLAWGLVVLSTIPPNVASSWTQATTALRVGILLKRRLLQGTLRLEPDEVRTEGAGRLLGKVLESNQLENVVTGGGLASLVAVTDLALAGFVLSLPSTGYRASIAFLVFVGMLGLFTLAMGTRVGEWTNARLRMTRELIERMVGHRTRLIQEPREQWHDSEDDALEQYAERSHALDRFSSWMDALPRAWMLVGIATLAPAFAAGELNGADLALSIGGVLLGYGAIDEVTIGCAAWLRARVAWREVGGLFRAGVREASLGTPDWVTTRASSQSEAVLEIRDVHFRYPGRPPVLRGVSLRVERGDRILLEGPSGGGKSTFASIVTGLRDAESGLRLLCGLDRQTLGDAGWRRRAVAAPQFHENHIIAAPLAFNVLMGRTWPPREADLAEARQVCVELGLGPLLDRMPSGIMQLVGETGWQLSHGERSRIFIARALVQRSDLLILDESFASLDPETLERALSCVVRRSGSLIVIAHP
jgi:ATP-binding cassette subfamily B protein